MPKQDQDQHQDQDEKTGPSAGKQLGELASYLFGAAGPFAAYVKNIDAKAAVGQTVDFYKQLFDIAVGKSDVEPDKKDWRFQDEAWTSNPFYHRLSQAYLAMSDAIEAMIPEDLPWEQKSRAQLAAQIATSTFAPTNTLLGNPAAITKTIETGGSNLVRGFKAFLEDWKENGGMPKQVDASNFEVGRNMAITPGKVVLRTRMFELLHYAPSTDKVYPVPVLLIPPQINRFYFTDLAPGRSFAEYVVSQGLQYFAISWRNPGPEEADFGLEDYGQAVVEAIEAVCEITGSAKVNTVGFCAGGITSASVAAALAAKGRDLVNSFTMCVTMLDFKTDNALGAFRLPTLLTVAKAQSAMKGVLEGQDLGKIFAWLRPNDLVWNYWVNNYLMGEAPPAFDILAWNNDSSNMAAKLHTDFLNLFDANALTRPGSYELLGEPVDLGQITCDSYVVGAVTDHLTPWKACYESRKLLGSKDCTFALSNGGHVAALVNPPGNPKAYHIVAPAKPDSADEWLESAEKMPGSWWEGWARWVAKRSGKKVTAPAEPGSKAHPPLMDAPGRYVKE